MAQQVRRQMNYVDGTAARQMYAAPARRVYEPERKAPSRRVAPQQRPQERHTFCHTYIGTSILNGNCWFVNSHLHTCHKPRCLVGLCCIEILVPVWYER